MTKEKAEKIRVTMRKEHRTLRTPKNWFRYRNLEVSKNSVKNYTLVCLLYDEVAQPT